MKDGAPKENRQLAIGIAGSELYPSLLGSKIISSIPEKIADGTSLAGALAIDNAFQGNRAAITVFTAKYAFNNSALYVLRAVAGEGGSCRPL
jgi:hypothetical protein